MSAAFIAGMAMTTVGLIAFLALTLGLILAAVAYSSQQVKLAMNQAGEPSASREVSRDDRPAEAKPARRAA